MKRENIREKDKLDKVFNILTRVCVYGVILCGGLLLFAQTYRAEAYGASAMVIILTGFILFIVNLNYRDSRR